MRKDIKKVCERALFEYNTEEKSCTQWRAAVFALLCELKCEDKGKLKFIELRYFKKYSFERVCELMPCAQITARLWREDVLGRLAAKAAYEKLIKP